MAAQHYLSAVKILMLSPLYLQWTTAERFEMVRDMADLLRAADADFNYIN